MAAVTRNKTVTFLRPTDPPKNELPETFIDRYTAWASNQTDAPVQYHRALGVSILSTLLTPHISLRMSYGPVIPNVWVMILAGTTITRKSTCLNLASRLLDDVADDWMLATEGSPEGLITELGFRDGKVSVFQRDEITQFMSAISGRDYMAGMVEGFCQLYDGVPQVRQLRKERIEIKKPYFIITGGGIKSRMEELVTMEHIRNGFIPRFIIVSGSTTREQMRPSGPPVDDDEDDDKARDALVEELWNIHQFYSRDEDADTGSVVKIAGIVKVKSSPQPKHVRLKGTPEFWERYQQLESDAIEMGMQSSAHELYTPLYLRLAITVKKVSMLLAAAEMRSVIELSDLQKAIHLSQEWVDSTTDFAANVEQQPEMDKWEKKAEKIINWVKAQDPEPITQTDIMQKFRIRKRDIADIEATLMARGAVEITPYPHPSNLAGSKILYRVSSTVHVNGRPLSRIDREDTLRVYGTEEGHKEAKRNGRRIRFPVRDEEDE